MAPSRRVPAQERGRETQQRVLEGAAEVFGASGYGNASIRSIADAAGVSLGAMNFHFPSKEEIALAVIQEQHKRAIALAEQVATEYESVIERLIYLSRAVAYQLMTDRIVVAGVELSLEVGEFIGPTVDSYDGWSHALYVQLADALASGELRSELNAAELAETYLGCFTGVQILSRVRTNRKELLLSVKNLWLVIFRGLVPPEREEFARQVLEEAFSPAALATLTA